jgi:hypothetical protein
VDDEASSLDEHVEELRQRVKETNHLGRVHPQRLAATRRSAPRDGLLIQPSRS